MKRAVVELRVLVTCEIPDHVLARDLEEQELGDVLHDYAVGAIQREVETQHGGTEDDWVKLYAEVTEHEVEEEPEDVS